MDQTPAHVASLMGNTISVGAFAQLKVDFDLPDGEGKSANNLLQVYGYTECLQLATGRKELVPPLVKAAHNLALPAMGKFVSTCAGFVNYFHYYNFY